MATVFRIHPAIGIARIGNSPDEFSSDRSAWSRRAAAVRVLENAGRHAGVAGVGAAQRAVAT